MEACILHALLNIKSETELDTYPKLGTFWERFALEEIIKAYYLRIEECFFGGGKQSGAELDLFFYRGGKRLGF